MTEEEKKDVEEQEEEAKEEKPLTHEDVEKMIQSETDRVRTEYSKKLKEKEAKLEEIEKEKMSEEEQKKYELEKYQKELAEKEQTINQKELRLKTIDLLKEKDIALDYLDVVIGTDEEDTAKRLERLVETRNKDLETFSKEKFKEVGREIDRGNDPDPDPEKMSDEEYVKFRHEQLYKK